MPGMNTIAVLCSAALGLLLFGLGFATSVARKNEKVAYSCDADPTNILYKLVRAHGNTAEYAPFLALLILYLGAHDPAAWVVWTMVAATVCRYLLALGIVGYPTMAKPNPLRFVGALGTYLAGLGLSAATLLTVW